VLQPSVNFNVLSNVTPHQITINPSTILIMSSLHHYSATSLGNRGDADDEGVDSLLLPDLLGKSDILEEKHVKELSKFLPARAEGYSWTLAFSTTTMGFSLKSLYRSLSRYEGPVLLIIKDNEHSVFGAFSSCNLKPSESFYGTGETYLFTFKQPIPATKSGIGGGGGTSTIKSNNQQSVSNNQTIINNQAISNSSSNNNNNNNINNNNNNTINISNNGTTFRRYPWTGDNLYFIKGGTDSLAFGAGEGNFGLWLDEDLYHGSSHPCKTFNNEPLANHEDFVVCTLECWCFL
jgi:hypothetical protein